MTAVIIGADIGGTSSRVGVANLTGRFLAVVTGGPANPNAVGIDSAGAEIRRVTDAALAAAGQGLGGTPTVAGVVIGLAGITGVADPEGFARAALDPILAGRPPLEVVTDLAVAYASGSPEPDGCVLIAGTGAMAGIIRSGVLDERRDGWGWLLGDDGSGFWLGREAVRATLADLEAGRELGPLGDAILDLVRTQVEPGPGGEYGASELIRSGYARPPRELSEYATLVAELADVDPVAARIADRAAEVLAATLGRLDPGPALPIVLAGSVLQPGPAGRPTPVGSRLRALLSERYENPLHEAGPGVVGAAWLAVPAAARSDRDLHRRLLASARDRSG
ncbi:N-acetylglucosamine kinase [Microlunatus parietis]|uniref:N-acetylglucosamine kinase-like BadF-type ATPase n=1 Tax=Microlunatus parietis TaxID=682979 RepID=A0A7Y9IEF5_9ACTN|nr:BadF/BadG/BcrA/BcrD ATPase family protein [Microlunatus parietis]NYE75357.1 N-acetylglucosamine kinase-like BadF-type ATPase [Microlunatus parietis]